MAPPQNELLRIGREQLGPYPGVEVREARAIRSAGSDSDFEVALGDGSVVETRKILLATGVHDELPERDLPLPLLPRLGGPRQAAGGAGEGRSPGDAGYPDPATLIRN
jgi:hypothetical protein